MTLLQVCLPALVILAAVAYVEGADSLPPPPMQLMSEVPPHEIECRNGLVPAFRSTGGQPACMTPHTLSVLAERGWALPPVIPADVAAANNAFAADLYGQISQSGGNMVFSPTNLRTAFSILYEGARHETAAQMEEVFGFDPDVVARHRGMSGMMVSINRDDPSVKLDLKNVLPTSDWFEPGPRYADIVRDVYLGKVYNVDSTGDGVDRITAWAADKKHAWTKDVKHVQVSGMEYFSNRPVPAAVTDSTARFQGSWETEFSEETSRLEFQVNETYSVDVEFMHLTGDFGHAMHDGVQVLRLPYEGGRFSMLVLLPDEADGLEVLERDLSAELVRRWRGDLNPTQVDVSMPNFRMSISRILDGHLKGLGMPDAFEPDAADLLGMLDVRPGERYGGPNLYMDAMPQVGSMSMNPRTTRITEETTVRDWAPSMEIPLVIVPLCFNGSETVHCAEVSPRSSLAADRPPGLPILDVAAVHAVEYSPEAARFVADRPFMFMILDDESGAILFMGRVSDPSMAYG